MHALRTIEQAGKPDNAKHWCWDETGKAPSGRKQFDVQRVSRRDTAPFSPVARRPDYPVAGQQGYKGAAWSCDIVKRWKVPFTVTLPDGTTEERSKWMWKRKLALLVYGKVVEFTFTNVRGSRVTRLQDDAKWDKSFALSQFVRMLDEKQGFAALSSLVGESETNEGAVAA